MVPKQDEELTGVAPADDMSKAIFTKHFTHRHSDSLAGMTELPEDISDAIADTYRAFHRQLHRTRIDLEHYHND